MPLSPYTIQIRTSVATLFELAGVQDGELNDGEIAYVTANKTFYNIDRQATTGALRCASKDGYWVVFSAGGSTGTRPTLPAGATHEWTFTQAATPTPQLVPDDIGTATLTLNGTFGTDFLVQQPRPFTSVKGVRLIAKNPYVFPLTVGGLATINDNANTPAGYTVGGVFDFTSVNQAGFDEIIMTVGAPGVGDLGFGVNNRGVLFQADVGGVFYSSQANIPPPFPFGTTFVAIEYDANGLVEVAGANQATFTGGSSTVTLIPIVSANSAAFTNGSATVAWDGVNPLPLTLAGHFVKLDADPVNDYRLVLSVDPTGHSMTLDGTYQGATATGVYDSIQFIPVGSFVRLGIDPVSNYCQVSGVQTGNTLALAGGYTGTPGPTTGAFEIVSSPANCRLYYNGELVASLPIANGGFSGNLTEAGVGIVGWVGELFTATRSFTTAELLTLATGYLGL